MTDDNENLKLRIASLEKEISSLKSTLGVFGIGLDKVGQIQELQTEVIDGLVKANSMQANYLKRLVENTELHNELLKRLLGKEDN